MQFTFLANDFYNDYSHCTEMEQKPSRPYIMVLATVDNIDFAIPLRSNINHPNVIWTDKANNCGLDLSKAVVINDKGKYIDSTKNPIIRQNEFNALKGKEQFIQQRMENYINAYKKALTKQNLPDKALLCKYSTLQYFHKELGIT